MLVKMYVIKSRLHLHRNALSSGDFVVSDSRGFNLLSRFLFKT